MCLVLLLILFIPEGFMIKMLNDDKIIIIILIII